MIRRIYMSLILIMVGHMAVGQVQTRVYVTLQGEELPYAIVEFDGRKHLTNFDGLAIIALEESQKATISADPGIGAEPKEVQLEPGETVRVDLDMKTFDIPTVVVTGTRTHLDRRESPIAVQVMDRKLLEATQSISVAEGLSFRPGLRMEYNCQNCGFSQVRLNGLSGPYTQILIDGRPIFSALSGVYGLEQLPSSMIERVEIVRGGGSSMYGGNAIAGTVNLITREPINDEFEISAQTAMLGFAAPDNNIQGHASWVDEKSGVQVWGALRNRAPFNANPDELYDRDGDGIPETADDFSELTRLQSAAIGARYWNRPTYNSRWQIETRGLYEFRRGGNRFDFEPHEADIAEQLIHRTAGLNGQYEWFEPNGRQRFTAYGAATYTSRSSYYGAGGNHPDPDVREQARNYYGETEDQIANAGLLYGYTWNEYHSAIAGIDIQYNHVQDDMPGYSRSINQTTFTPAIYAQWSWTLNEYFTIQSGARYDRPQITSINAFGGESALNRADTYDAFNPRLSILYKQSHHFRVRASFATGFRAPQAFDEDLHLSTLGGDARIVRLSSNLEVEKSNSWNLGVELDHHSGPWEGRVSIDGFYTQLANPFVDVPFTDVLVENGDTIALIDTKINDPNGAYVAGANIELEWVHPKWAIQAGWTLQAARYEEAREWYPGWTTDKMLRAPWSYGYALVGYIPNDRWRTDLSATFTGSMVTPNERLGKLVTTPFFADVNASIQRKWEIKNAHFTTEVGVYNILNQYQSDVEVGWERDANYFFGPIRPRSIYLSVTYGF